VTQASPQTIVIEPANPKRRLRSGIPIHRLFTDTVRNAGVQAADSLRVPCSVSAPESAMDTFAEGGCFGWGWAPGMPIGAVERWFYNTTIFMGILLPGRRLLQWRISRGLRLPQCVPIAPQRVPWLCQCYAGADYPGQRSPAEDNAGALERDRANSWARADRDFSRSNVL